MSAGTIKRPVRAAVALFAALLLMTALLFGAGCGNGTDLAGPAPQAPSGPAPATGAPTVDGTLTVSFIDVGQADSILVRSGDAAMLIDAGNNADADTVVDYLKAAGVTRLNAVVGTHPHEDHIGGLDAVIRAFPIDTIYMPRATTTTRTYADVLQAIKDKGLKITAPDMDSGFDLGEAHCQFLAPRGTKYDDLNDYSIVIRLTFGSTSFLFAGDAGTASEAEMLAAGVNLRADVLKVGHHGSSTSSSAKFLDAVKPASAVISVGKDNDYGHPHRATLSRLAERGIAIYRTDHAGTIVATSDGTRVSFDAQPEK